MTDPKALAEAIERVKRAVNLDSGWSRVGIRKADARLLLAAVEKMPSRAQLEAIEWAALSPALDAFDDVAVCPACRCAHPGDQAAERLSVPTGHQPDCWLATLLEAR